MRGKGNPESFESCSHGAGRVMSRIQAKKRYTVADQIAATAGVECCKDADVIDEIPMAHKDIDAVKAAARSCAGRGRYAPLRDAAVHSRSGTCVGTGTWRGRRHRRG